MKKALLPVLLSLMLAACTSSRQTTDSNASVSDADPSTVTTINRDDVGSTSLSELTDPNSPLSTRSVYFEFDSYVVQPSYNNLLDAHARYLNQHRDMRMMIQGNTDERGSREYNLALGQKRAEAVKRALSMRGVSEGQLEAVSLGKEKPRCVESNETCYAENRRGDMLYSGEFTSAY